MPERSFFAMTDMKEENRIGRNIQSCCMQQGLSYYALARKAGIPLTTLLHILDGTSRNPGVYTLLRICGPLGISLTDLLREK